jgi:hypothetical protein
MWSPINLLSWFGRKFERTVFERTTSSRLNEWIFSTFLVPNQCLVHKPPWIPVTANTFGWSQALCYNWVWLYLNWKWFSSLKYLSELKHESVSDKLREHSTDREVRMRAEDSNLDPASPWSSCLLFEGGIAPTDYWSDEPGQGSPPPGTKRCPRRRLIRDKLEKTCFKHLINIERHYQTLSFYSSACQRRLILLLKVTLFKWRF